MDDIEMPGVLPLYGHQRGGDFRDVPESLVVQGGIPLPDLPKAITLFELLNPNGCRYIRQVVLVARGENLVVPRSFGGIALPGVLTDPMETHDPHPLRPLWVLGRCHATFACRDRLGSIKGKAGDIANRPDHFPLVPSRKGVGSIFDHL